MLKEQYMILLSAEASLVKQQAKVSWLQMGDRNTAFYHAKIKQRRARNQVSSICNGNGERVSDPQSIQSVFLGFYQGLLGIAPGQLCPLDMSFMQQGPALSSEQQNALIAPIQPNEIKDALFSIDDEKAPGPDGFSAGFFKACWHIIQEDFTAAILDFFTSSKILRQINATNLCLL